MAGLFYFLPEIEPAALQGGGSINHDLLEPFGLAGSLADVKQDGRDVIVAGIKKGGPGNRPGTIFAPVSPDLADNSVQAIYKPERQTWIDMLGGEFAIGWWNDKLPVPDELARRKRYDGYSIIDCHDQKWHVPIARSGDGRLCTLPTFHHFDPATLQPRRIIQPQYSHLWEIAGLAFDFYSGKWPEDEEPPSVTQQLMWAVEALAVNYRIGPAELAALGACGRNPCDADTVGKILFALSDYAVFDNAIKNLPAGVAPAVPASSSSTPTEADDSKATNQAAAN